MELALITLSIGLIIFFAYVFSSIFNKFRIPDVLFLLIIGLIFGPITGIVDVSKFGILGNLFATLTLLLILFEGGLNIKLKGLAETAGKATLLMFVTLILSILAVVPFGLFVFDLSLIEAILVGVIVGGISSGIVVPIAEKLPVSDKTKSMLTLESNINDIVTVSIFFAIIGFLGSGVFNAGMFAITFSTNFLASILAGIFIAVIWSQLLRKMRNVENNVFMTPALILAVFGATELLGLSGIMAVFAFGITLGNLQFAHRERFARFLVFKEFFLTKWEKRMFIDAVFLLKTYFFVYIGLSIPLNNITVLWVGALITVLLFVARTLAVKLSIRKDMPEFDKKVLQSLIPKGLVGAALVILIANQTVQDLSYAIILFSIIFTSILIPLLPKAEKETKKENGEVNGSGNENQDPNITTEQQPQRA